MATEESQTKTLRDVYECTEGCDLLTVTGGKCRFCGSPKELKERFDPATGEVVEEAA